MASQAVEHVSHPLYRRDLDSNTSQDELASKPVGELLLRPSSKIGDLVAVLKTADETYWHIREYSLASYSPHLGGSTKRLRSQL
jgi:hypothetical protein